MGCDKSDVSGLCRDNCSALAENASQQHLLCCDPSKGLIDYVDPTRGRARVLRIRCTLQSMGPWRREADTVVEAPAPVC